VATTQLLPVYAKLGRKILRRSAQIHGIAGTEFVEGLDRFWLALRCPLHAWSWPRANRDERLGHYDSHQTCHKCTSRRMFDTHEWQAGPIYKKYEKKHAGTI
jgi:hypothetical protein